MTAHEMEVLAQLEATFPVLDGWFERTKGDPERPQSGSELYADNQTFEPWLISEVARVSLSSGVEHLRLLRVAIERQQLFPRAMFTALRGALVGACQGVWVLAPDSGATRQARGHTVIAHEYEQLEKYYTEAEKMQSGSVPPDQSAWIRLRRDELGVARGGSRAALNQTEMIQQALTEAFPSDSNKQLTGRLLWRQMSADAHILTWALAQRGSVHQKPAKGELLAVHSSATPLDEIAEAFLCAFELLRRGWSLFDRRCEAP